MRTCVDAIVVARCLVLGLALLAVPMSSDGGERHAGTVLGVDIAGRTVTLDEYGANAVRRTVPIRLSSDARIVWSERTEPEVDFDRPFTITPINLADLRVGDFVVVELGEGPKVATLVVVTLRGGS